MTRCKICNTLLESPISISTGICNRCMGPTIRNLDERTANPIPTKYDFPNDDDERKKISTYRFIKKSNHKKNSNDSKIKSVSIPQINKLGFSISGFLYKVLSCLLGRNSPNLFKGILL